MVRYTLEQIQAMHTVPLLEHYRNASRFYCEWEWDCLTDEDKADHRTYKAMLKSELATRPHVPRKSERKTARLDKLKQNRNK